MEETALLAALLSGGAVASLALFFWSTRFALPSLGKRIARFTQPDASAFAPVGAGGRRAAEARGLAARELGSPLTRGLAHDLWRARVPLSVRTFLALSGLLALALFVPVALATGELFPAALAAGVGAAAPFWWTRVRREQVLDAFNEQLPDTLAVLMNAVRAGNSLPQALDRAAREAPEPTRSAFARIVREIGLGVSVDEALEELARAYPSEDLDVLVTAIGVQYQVGGNLTRVLELLAETIRERARLIGDVKALTSQQRYSAYLLAGLPVFVGAALFLISPEYMLVLFEPGPLRLVLLLDLVLIGLGFLVMRRLGRVEL